MKTKFLVTIEIESEHSNGSFIDQNSIKPIVGKMLSSIDCKNTRLWEYSEKNEGPTKKNPIIKLCSLSEHVDGTSDIIDIQDIKDYISPV